MDPQTGSANQQPPDQPSPTGQWPSPTGQWPPPESGADNRPPAWQEIDEWHTGPTPAVPAATTPPPAAPGTGHPGHPGYPQPQQWAQPGYPQPQVAHQQWAQPGYPQPQVAHQQWAQPGYPQPYVPQPPAAQLGGHTPSVVVGTLPRVARADIASGVVLVVAAVVTSFASFMRWVRAEIPLLGTRVGTGWENIEGRHNAGLWVTLLAVCLAVGGALVATGVKARFVRPAVVVAALGLVTLAAWQWYDLLTPPAEVTASPGAGMWLLSGAAVVALGAVVASLRVRTDRGGTGATR